MPEGRPVKEQSRSVLVEIQEHVLKPVQVEALTAGVVKVRKAVQQQILRARKEERAGWRLNLVHLGSSEPLSVPL